MNLTSLIVVVVRLLALNFMVTLATQGVPMVLQSVAYLNMPPLAGSGPSDWLMLWPWVYVIALVACAVVLWIYAGRIARLVTKGEAQQISLGALTLVDCYTVAFMVVGLIYMAANVAAVLNWMHYYVTVTDERRAFLGPEANGYTLSQAVITFLAGFLLLVKARKWSHALARRHGADDPK